MLTAAFIRLYSLPPLVLLVVLCLVGGCSRLPVRKASAPPPPPPPAPEELGFDFRDVQPAAGSSALARLDYYVSAPDGGAAMELTDPQQPRGTQLKLALCTVKAAPYVDRPRITDRHAKECKVNCLYTLCVREPKGAHVGDFEVNGWGALVLKRGTVDTSLEYDRASTAQRTVYFFYRKLPGGPRGELLFALEYKSNKLPTRRELLAGDGWRYTFWAPDGRLLVHAPAGLGNLPEDLLAQASAEDAQRRQDLDIWQEQQARDAARDRCSTGGG